MTETVGSIEEQPDPRLAYDPESVTYFERENEDSPLVGFAYDTDRSVRLIIVAHDIAGLPGHEDEFGTPIKFQIAEPPRMPFTPEEWVALYLGIQINGDWDFPESDRNVYFGDSKDPSFFFIITDTGFRPWRQAMAVGKYNLLPDQEARIRQKLEAVPPG